MLAKYLLPFSLYGKDLSGYFYCQLYPSDDPTKSFCFPKLFHAVNLCSHYHEGKAPLSERQSAFVSTPTVPRLVGSSAVDRAEGPFQLHIHTPS